MPYYLAPSLQQLRSQLNAHYPGRDKTSDGWIGDTSHAARPSDHNPDPPPDGIVRAYDIDEDVLGAAVDEGDEPMRLVERLLRDERVQYVIYEGRIWNRRYAASGWRAYTGVNAHRLHIHVSIRHGAQWEQDVRPWPVAPPPPAPTAEDTMTPDQERTAADRFDQHSRVLGELQTRAANTEQALVDANRELRGVRSDLRELIDLLNQKG